MKKTNKTIGGFIKSHLLSCTCIMLAIITLLSGTAAFSKYVSSSPAGGGSGTGSFSATATIDDVSALSFTNTAFWGGTVEDDKIAMNALRSINFSVNNFEVIDGVEKVAEVKMRYSLTFSAPVNFVKRLAIQPFNESDKPMLPQIVLNDFINASEHNHPFQTAISEDFNSVYHHDLTFITTKTDTTYTGVFDGTIHEEPVKVTIKLERYNQSTHQLLQFRAWDTSGITDALNPTVTEEGGKLLPPLQIKFTRDIPFYRITIAMSNMVMPAGEKTTKKHSIRLAPTDALDDDHLAGYLVEEYPNGEWHPVKTIYGASTQGESVQYTMQTVRQQATDRYYIDPLGFTNPNNESYYKRNHFNEQVVVNHDTNLMGSVHYYEEGETGFFDNTESSTSIKAGSFSHEEREYIDGQDIYLKRTGTAGNYQWQLVGVNAPPAVSNETNTYYKLHVTYGEIVTKTEVKLTEGILKSESISTEKYTVRSVTTNGDHSHDNVVFDVISRDILRYTVLDNAVGTRTVTKSIDIEEEGLTLSVGTSNGLGWSWSPTSQTIYEPNLNVKPLVAESLTYDGADGVVAYEKEVTDYIVKTLIRDVERVTVDVEQVKTTSIDGEGNPKDTFYTKDSPLNLFNGSNIQQMFISQCYSKNYPFYVNVIFEQVL
ncbi:MAG: hypothetical protein IKD14_00815 [Clostridia bacterium]|nr:hypothetical protein [Clostridia bacterium]